MVRLGGWIALGVSAVIAVSLPVRNVDWNAANVWTLVLAAAGGGLAAWLGRRAAIGASVLIALAALPALFGWVGWLYVPSLILILVGAHRDRTA